MFMRPSPQLERDRAHEMAVDEENALREYDCEAGPTGGTRVFDSASVDSCVVEGRPLVIHAPKGARIGAGGDLALIRDSATIMVVSRIGDAYELLESDEVRPGKGTPLVPSGVILGRFVPVLNRHGASSIALDQHYREAAREHLLAARVKLVEAPDTNEFKLDSYMAARAIMRSGQLRLPKIPRLLQQLKNVTQTPLDRGRYKISSPRRAGQGHGDLVSALVLALWQAKTGSSRSQEQIKSQFERTMAFNAGASASAYGADTEYIRPGGWAR
jgi:hypothetical protein